MNKKYDVIIVGAGPTGIYSTYELIKRKPDIKVLLVDKGQDIYSRNCPILNKINPATIITDSFYSLAIYESYDRFIFDIY